MEPRWTRGAKDAVGTAYSTSSRLWYTLFGGVVTEVYYPTIDTPQIRDLQYLVTDGATFFHDERRHLKNEQSCLEEAALGCRIVNKDPGCRYSIRKTVIGDPHQNCLLLHTALTVSPALAGKLRLYVLCAPHLEIGGWHNSGEVLEVKGRKVLVAYKGDTWLALAATAPFLQCSCGYVGVNDGWTDLSQNYVMDWEYDAAFDGNIALTGQIDLSQGLEFTLGLAFGTTLHNALSTLLQSVSVPFEQNYANFISQWHRTARRFALMEKLKRPDGILFEHSVNLLLAHEDKTYPGAMIASLSIPWGEDKGDEEVGGYHLVWTRDLVNCATALLAVGDLTTPLRALIYLAVSQREDGGFHQNFWIDGQPYWQGIQLDEVSFPIILAWRLHEQGALGNLDPYPMVVRACGYLVREGPVTPQDRWEEASGYSPYTLAANIAALVCAADLLEKHGDPATAEFVREYADFLESHIEEWTVTTQGTLLPEIPRHYIRINPAPATGSRGDEDPNRGLLVLANQAPGGRYLYPAKEIVGADFLQLVRYGIRRAGDALVEDSLRVVDAVLKAETSRGPCWRRYNHDGYGQRSDGSSFNVWGKGRPWPLLTGERGHYELAAGRDPAPYLQAMEKFAHGAGLLPEQVWDEPDLADRRLYFGAPTGSAIPLMWAHAEYIQLLRSVADGRVFDLLEPVVARYSKPSTARGRSPLEIWKFNRPIRSLAAGARLRIQACAPFRLHWTDDEWQHARDTLSTATAIGLQYVDLATTPRSRAPFRFTFYWPEANRWEGSDYMVELRDPKS